MSVLLEGHKISKVFGEHILLKEIAFEILEDEKVGIVGNNGCGKSTFLEMIAGLKSPSSGNYHWYKDCNIAYMPQVISESLEEGPLSGGEKTKKRVQKVLYQKHNVLILDEPTNHLDRNGIKWLIKEIQKDKGTVIVVSHDRYFLDQCVERIIEIEDGKLKNYPGNYSWYWEEKQRQFESQLHAYEEQEKRKQKIEAEMKKLTAWSLKAHNEAAAKAIATGNKKGGKEFNRKKAKKRDQQIKSRMKRLTKMEETSILKPRQAQNIAFELQEKQKGNKRILEAKNLQKYFGSKCLFKQSQFYINRGEKVGLYGGNGCGKTTLIKMLLGEEAVEGELFLSQSIQIGYMSQEVTDLPGDLSIQDYLDVYEKDQLTDVQEKLAQMGFKRGSLNHKLSEFSHGEQMKIKLFKMMLQKCDVLILDEPTNHMDLHVRETLEQVLLDYTGTVLLVTHDAYMMEKLCDKLLVFERQQIKRIEGGLKYYEEKEKQKIEHKHVNQKAQLLKIDYELTYLISTLSQLTPGEAKYQEMEQTYQEKLAEKRSLMGS